MPLEGPNPDLLPEKLRDHIANMKLAGNDTRAMEAMANAPHLQTFYGFHFYKEVFFRGIAPIRIKELVRLRLSMLHGCAM